MAYFDDLISDARSATPSGGYFGDLIAEAKKQPERGPVARALTKAAEPITSYPATEAQMARESAGQVAAGIGQIASGVRSAVNPNAAASPEPDNRPEWLKSAAPTNDQGLTDILKGAGNAAVGAAGYVTAPVNAALRTFAGKPIEENTGIPKEYTEFAASLALPMPKRIPFPAPKVAAPTMQELRTTAQAGYQSPEVAAVTLDPAGVSRLAQDIEGGLKSGTLNMAPGAVPRPVIRQLAERTFGVIDEAKANPQDFATLTSLDGLRKLFGEAANTLDKTDRMAAVRAKKAIDSYLDDLSAGGPRAADVVAGDMSAAGPILKEARGNTAAAESADLLDQKQLRAELRAAAANSGQNVTNALRSRVADILLNPAERRGYSAPELAMMQRIVNGSSVENIIRGTGKVLGGGGGMHSFIAGIPTMGVAPAVGFALTKLSNGMTRANVAKLNEMVRMDSPLGRQISAPLEDWARAAQAAEQDPSGRSLAMLTITSRNLANNLKDAGMAVSPDDILRTFRPGTVPAGAEDKQQ
jgi:hypothetical protein